MTILIQTIHRLHAPNKNLRNIYKCVLFKSIQWSQSLKRCFILYILEIDYLANVAHHARGGMSYGPIFSNINIMPSTTNNKIYWHNLSNSCDIRPIGFSFLLFILFIADIIYIIEKPSGTTKNNVCVDGCGNNSGKVTDKL